MDINHNCQYLLEKFADVLKEKFDIALDVSIEETHNLYCNGQQIFYPEDILVMIFFASSLVWEGGGGRSCVQKKKKNCWF